MAACHHANCKWVNDTIFESYCARWLEGGHWICKACGKTFPLKFPLGDPRWQDQKQRPAQTA